MKVLFVSMPSVHFTKWIESIDNPNLELYWFDVTNRGPIETKAAITQFVDWKKRKRKHVKGEFFLYKKFPFFYQKIKSFFELTESEKLIEIINEIQPDVVHSFEMQVCSYPILQAMQKNKNLPWIYSCWGSDLFYYKDFYKHRKQIKKVLQRINYLITDCQRDFVLAQQLSFSGQYLGLIPGGVCCKTVDSVYKLPLEQRKIILVKGYQHQFGRAISILEALQKVAVATEYEVVVFGAHLTVYNYCIDNKLPYQVFHRSALSNEEVLQLMGQSILYIGSSISDGIPNTLLEAISMQAFPIQSNPGNATAEIIQHGQNGFLIQNPEDVTEISHLIERALRNAKLLMNAQEINDTLAQERLDCVANRKKINLIYDSINKK